MVKLCVRKRVPNKPKKFSLTRSSGKVKQQPTIERRGHTKHDRYNHGKRRNDPVLSKNQKIYNSQRWKDVRAYVKAHKPLCFDPFKEHTKKGMVVVGKHTHHIKPLWKRPELAFVTSNLVRLCEACHNRIDALERKDIDTEHLFNAEDEGT